ncbi:Predicted kinase, aminoglycoside phosphotransferase (APT) family [Halogranum rubrum]|uniref:Predicted kinase, aminoglycoside phosphotransferase (APT) family n=1 Tax=Halogranum rubrum TaxID=553466 RepID=A0A1I4CMQ2_9EURY|nr:phosphotransferase [Halogranum rubrum]SFK82518.1 Predicted kinase, aminoglycoside phosphotransferase (APT) family [Halogranum rubrum]
MSDAWDARDVLRQVAPERRVASTTSIRRGNHKQTTIATFADGDHVVVQLSSDPDALRTEFALARAVRERTSIPVPSVVAAGEIDDGGETGYVVVERAAGVDLHTQFADLSSDDQRRLAHSFGRYLAELHEAFRFDGYGNVVASGGDGKAEPTTFEVRTPETAWSSWFYAYAREGVDALPPAFDSLRADLFDAIVASDLPTAPASVLFPWDLRPGNALVDDGSVTAVLDWGDPLAAAAGLSVAKTEHLVADWYVSDEAPLRAAFRAGYRSVRPLPATPTLYRIVAVVRSAVDSQGVVTRPQYPELGGQAAVDFHADRLSDLLSSLPPDS